LICAIVDADVGTFVMQLAQAQRPASGHVDVAASSAVSSLPSSLPASLPPTWDMS